MGEMKYVMGHSDTEIRRLIDQAAFIGETTKRLLSSAGIRPGMRVLDIGCGAGDVTMQAARLVGLCGEVVGIDPNKKVLAIARERARQVGLPHVTFTAASVDSFDDPRPFDFVVGRYVLIHQGDPVGFLRTASRFARPDGTFALHEVVADEPLRCVPPVALWREVEDRVRATIHTVVPSWDAGGRLVELFERAGLAQPNLFSETPVGGGADAPHFGWLVELARTFLPHMVERGIATPETFDLDTLERRLSMAVADAHAQVWAAPQICAWTTVRPGA